MGIGITQIHHIQILVPREVEQQAKHFYGTLLGLPEIPKPEPYRATGGAWYELDGKQLHLSLDDGPMDNHVRRRHVCFMVSDLAHAEKIMRAAGVPIIPDSKPFDQWARFYAEDPGGNRIEVAQFR
jgi:catechol 2,3-dioxygenase-like lactoylglutathione lyase family enzyme